jgi:hypothetical protein
VTHSYRCFGIEIASALEFPGAWGTSPPRDPTTQLVVGELGPGFTAGDDGWEAVVDGRPFSARIGAEGECRFVCDGQALFELSADGRVLTADGAAVRDAYWARVLLDSVLFTVSLIRGGDALHAGAVVTASGAAVAVIGSSGGGKSTLVAELLRHGCQLVTDDVLFVDVSAGTVMAHPGPPVMTLPRQRADGVGTRIAEIGDEVWAAVPVVSAAVPVHRIVMLDRRPSVAVQMVQVTHALHPLLTHLLAFPRTRPRELGRFNLASVLASEVELWQLIADVTTPPAELAAHVLEGPSHSAKAVAPVAQP